MEALSTATVQIVWTIATYTVLSIGFNYLWSINRFFDIGYAAQILVGAYSFYAFERAGASLPVAACGALGISVICALILERFVYVRLRAQYASPLMSLIVSVGVLAVVQGVVSMLFTTQSQTLVVAEHYFRFSTVSVSYSQILTIILGCIVYMCARYVSTHTSFGTQVRAVQDNEQLARTSGVGIARVRSLSVMCAAVCATVAGIGVGLNTSINPAFSMSLLLDAVVISMIFGLGNIPRAIYGAMLFSCIEVASVWVVGPGWKDATTFSVLIMLLLYRSAKT